MKCKTLRLQSVFSHTTLYIIRYTIYYYISTLFISWVTIRASIFRYSYFNCTWCCAVYFHIHIGNRAIWSLTANPMKRHRFVYTIHWTWALILRSTYLLPRGVLFFRILSKAFNCNLSICLNSLACIYHVNIPKETTKKKTANRERGKPR